jgi:hypothetical protein
LEYSGILKDQTILKAYVYDKLSKRLGCRTAYVRKNLLVESQVGNTYTTKKVVKRVMPKKTITKIICHCLACGKAGYTKVNCPGVKRTKKVNHMYQDEEEISENSDVEYIVEEEDDEEEDDEIEDDDDDEESQNCFSVKKSCSQPGSYKDQKEEIPYFQV